MEETQTQQEPQMEAVPEQLVGLPAQLLQDILVYLGTKPHTEVDPYIKAINNTAKMVNLVRK